MKVFHIDSSVRGNWSVSKDLTRHFVQQLKEKFPDATIDHLDLAEHTPSHPTPLFIQANYAAPNHRTAEMWEALAESNSLVQRMHDANVIVFGVPMHNFSIPSILKAFIDNIVRINETFAMTVDGIEGLLKNKKVYVISTRGVDFNNPHMEAMDQIKPYLRTVFGFIGMTAVEFIDVSPVQFADQEARNEAISKAKQSINVHISNLNTVE